MCAKSRVWVCARSIFRAVYGYCAQRAFLKSRVWVLCAKSISKELCMVIVRKEQCMGSVREEQF